MPRCTVRRTIRDYHQRFNPFRSVRWRYERVVERLNSGARIPDKGNEDEYVRQAVRFYRTWNKLTADVPPEDLDGRRIHLFPLHPGLYCANEVFSAPTEAMKHAIEACILSGQTDEQISDKIGMLPEAVEWYESMFFNVRDRLRNRLYIAKHVLGPAITLGMHDQLNGFTAKFFGYFAGPTVLDAILFGYDVSTATPAGGNEVKPFFDEHATTQLRRRSAEAANTFEVNKYNVMQLFEIHASLIEQARLAQIEGAKASSIERNLTELLAGVQWQVGSDRDKYVGQSPLRDVIGYSRELRVSELTAVMHGQSPLTAEVLKQHTFPPPRKVGHENPEQGS